MKRKITHPSTESFLTLICGIELIFFIVSCLASFFFFSITCASLQPPQLPGSLKQSLRYPLLSTEDVCNLLCELIETKFPRSHIPSTRSTLSLTVPLSSHFTPVPPSHRSVSHAALHCPCFSLPLAASFFLKFDFYFQRSPLRLCWTLAHPPWLPTALKVLR